MVTRRISSSIMAAACAGVVVVSVQAPVGAAEGNKACGLLTASELESALGVKVSVSGNSSMAAAKVELCTGETLAHKGLLRLATGTSGNGGAEKAGIEAAKKMGAQIDVKIFGPITCSTMGPPASLAQYGFNTTCTVSKATAVAGIEVTAKSQKDMVSIDQLCPLAEKMIDRF